MTHRFDPESIDLRELAETLRTSCGPTVVGAIVGRTRVRDEVVRHLGCSQLEGERLVDTMIGRGFLRRSAEPGEIVEWVIDAE